MISDAESHAAEDAERKEAAEARNAADHTAYQIEKQLSEHGDKLTDDERRQVQDKVTDLRKLLTEDSPADTLRTATQELLTSAQVLGQKIYEASQQSGETAGEGDGGADEVVEAEIVEDDES